jgi:hypothetical protein
MLMRVVAVMLLLSAGIAAEAMSYSFVSKASTTWNLEWFPSGSANEASIEQQNQRIKEEAETGKNIRKREVAIALSSLGLD